MGYAFSVFGVDLVKLKNVWGSGDTRLAKRLATKYADRYKDKDDWFDHYIEKGAPTSATAMDELVAGKPTAKQHGFQYGYALEVLCMHYGARVDKASLTWFDDVLDPLLKKAKQPKLGKLLGQGTFPIPIPKPSDFPEIGTIDTKAGVALVKAMNAIEPLAGDDENLLMCINEARGWVARANKKQRQVVWFIY